MCKSRGYGLTRVHEALDVLTRSHYLLWEQLWDQEQAMTVRNLLSAAKVTSAKPGPGSRPKLYGDGGGLYLHVHRAKAGEKVHRSWIFRFRSPVTGKTRDMGIGSADDCGLAESRERAAALRKVLRDGADPIDSRQSTRAGQLRASVLASKDAARTFEAVAEAAIVSMR